MTEAIEKFSVILKKLDETMLEQVRQWRNSPEVSRYMFTQDYISPEQQLAWFAKLQQDPSRLCFVVHFKGEAIGVANLTAPSGVNLADAPRIYTGFYLGSNRYRGTTLPFLPALALNDYCFSDLNCPELAAEVLNTNRAAIRFNQGLGYEIAEEKEGVTLMLLKPSEHQKALQRMQRFIQ